MLSNMELYHNRIPTHAFEVKEKKRERKIYNSFTSLSSKPQISFFRVAVLKKKKRESTKMPAARAARLLYGLD